MSDYSSDSGNSPGNSRSSDGSDRSDSGRRRSNNRGGRRDGNRGGRRDGGRRDGNRGGRRDGNRGGNHNRDSNAAPRRTPRPQPLTFWQKILKAIGLYDPNKPTKRTSPSRVPKPEPRQGASGGNREPRGERKARTGTRNTRGNPKPVETTRLYVGNLSYDATEPDLEDLFKGAGTVGSVEVVYNRNTHRSKGYAFIEMASIEEAKRAVETLHDQTFMDRQLIVSGAKSKGPADAEDRDDDREDHDNDEEDRENRATSGSDSEEAA